MVKYIVELRMFKIIPIVFNQENLNSPKWFANFEALGV
jgi:hypothetical protein